MILYFKKKYGKWKVNHMCGQPPLTAQECVKLAGIRPVFTRKKIAELKAAGIIGEKKKITNTKKIHKTEEINNLNKQ